MADRESDQGQVLQKFEPRRQVSRLVDRPLYGPYRDDGGGGVDGAGGFVAARLVHGRGDLEEDALGCGYSEEFLKHMMVYRTDKNSWISVYRGCQAVQFGQLVHTAPTPLTSSTP